MESLKILDFSYISRELKLQLEILKLNSNEEINQIDSKCFYHIDWNEFLALSIHHRTFCNLYKKMKLINKINIPKFVLRNLEDLYKRNIFKMLRFTAEMDNINKKLKEHKIKFLLLKGPALAKELYGDISLRTSSDLDILIPIEKLKEVEQLLQNEGYLKNDYIRSVLNDWKWRHHHVTYFHPIKKVKLEIHWRLNPGPAKEPSFSELWERKKISQLTNSPQYLLGNEDLFLFLVSHGARHGWSRLRWLLDIHKIIERNEIDFNELKRLSRKHHNIHLLGQSIKLTSELFSTKVVDDLKDINNNKRSIKLANSAIFYLKNKVNLHFYPLPEEISSYHKNYMFHLKTPLQKLLFVMSFFYPYPEDQDILPLPRRLHFMYFPLRPILWLWSKVRPQAQPIKRGISNE